MNIGDHAKKLAVMPSSWHNHDHVLVMTMVYSWHGDHGFQPQPRERLQITGLCETKSAILISMLIQECHLPETFFGAALRSSYFLQLRMALSI